MSATRESFVVTIDGPAGAGKSTVARTLAKRLGYSFLDSGALYRATAWAAHQRGIDWSDGTELGRLVDQLEIRFSRKNDQERVLVGEEDVTEAIRRPEISQGASKVSSLPEVRAGLLAAQRRIGERGHVVAEGRDMGTVVFPAAQAKFFLTAPISERARRRSLELAAAGRPQPFESVLEDMRMRDERDSTRAVAPLRRAADALEIDCGSMSPEQVVQAMIDAVRVRGG